MQSRTNLHLSGAELRGDLAPLRRRERAAVLATEVHDEEIVNVLGMHEDETYLEVVPMTSPLRACTQAALSSEANSRQCGVESEQPCSQKMVHEEEIVNVPEMQKGEEVDVAPPGVRVGAEHRDDATGSQSPLI